jgi:hypothetical protein
LVCKININPCHSINDGSHCFNGYAFINPLGENNLIVNFIPTCHIKLVEMYPIGGLRQAQIDILGLNNFKFKLELPFLSESD